MKEQVFPDFAIPPQPPLYVFVDEHGNLDFTRNGTKYLILTALSCQRPFQWYPSIANLRFDIIEQFNLDIEHFHATVDAKPTKRRVFELISSFSNRFRLDSIIIEKRKTYPKLQLDTRFYPEMLGMLLDYVIKGWSFKYMVPETIVFTDTIPHRKKRGVVEKAIKSHLKSRLQGNSYRVYHHSSKSSVGLQVVDYCCWAMQRKWVLNDTTSHNYIKRAVECGSEFEVFKCGENYYY